MPHDFQWSDKAIVVARGADEADTYAGAVQCARCGLRGPLKIKSPEVARALLEAFRRPENNPDDGECELILAEHVMND